MSRDFTLTKYEELCDVILRSGYVTISVKDYLLMQPKEKTVIPGHLAEHSSARLNKCMAFGCPANFWFARLNKCMAFGCPANFWFARLNKYKAFGCLAKTKFLRDRRNRRFRQVM